MRDVQITYKVGTHSFNTIDEIKASLDSAVKLTLDETVKEVKEWIVPNVPIDTGALQDSLQPIQTFLQGKSKIEIHSNLEYARRADKHKPYLTELRQYLKERIDVNILKGLNNEGLK